MLRLALLGLVLVAFARPAQADFFGPSSEKSGPFMLDLKIGPAFGLHDAGGAGREAFAYSAASLALDLGIAVTPDRRGYLLTPLQTLVGAWYTALLFPIGFEYDFKWTPGSTFLVARFSAGYALVHTYYLRKELSFAFLLPELGIRHVVKKRWNLGFDFFSLPIGFGKDDNGVVVSAIFYRMVFYAGANF